jgi:hypothetical protein
MPEVGSQVLKFRNSLFYLRRVGETGSHAPPDPRHAAWRRQLTRQLHDHGRTIVGVEERQGEGAAIAFQTQRRSIPAKNQ